MAPTPAPIGANPETVTDIQYGELVQNLDNALAACNADKADIAKLVQVK